LVTEVRGVGALWGVSVPDPVGTRDRMLDLGVIVRPIAPVSLAMCPPLVITDDDLDAIPAALRAALTA
jgi:acetylornithine/N-succinyldiaminopimelate aminotransferase